MQSRLLAFTLIALPALALPCAAAEPPSAPFANVECEGLYPAHLQGICTDGKQCIYWSFTEVLVKTGLDGKVIKRIPVVSHHGDLCFHGGQVHVAVNLGEFNNPRGLADSWVYVYNADDLALIARHQVAEVFHGAGGMGFHDGHFYVVGGLPDGIQENYIYEYNPEFEFQAKHVLKSGHTKMGIQAAAFAHGRWWFGCYGDPKILLVTDADFNMIGRFEYDCSLGVTGLADGRFLSASGQRVRSEGYSGRAKIAVATDETGLRIVASGSR